MTIQTIELTKKYSSSMTALSGVSLDIDTGIFGLLGKNGSGKTTLMRILTTLLEPTTGTVTVLDQKVSKRNQREIKSNIGYLPQEFGFCKDFSVDEILQYLCLLRGTHKSVQRTLIHDVLEKVNLTDQQKKKYKQLSGGMKRRVGLAGAMLHNPPILIVDEPTAGVDPEERINIRKLLAAYGEKHTVLFSTHIAQDIEYTCSKLAVLDGGKLLFSGELEELLNLANGKVYECIFDTLADFQDFERGHTVISFKRDGDKTRAIAVGDTAPLPNSIAYHPTLEEAYVYITTKEREQNGRV